MRGSVDFDAIRLYSRSTFNPPLFRRPHLKGSAANANFHLLRQLVRRDLAVRFRGSALGIGWAVLHPLILVALYWFVFTRIFVMRSGPVGGVPYVVFMIAGLLPWLGISEGVMRSTTSMVDSGPIVRKLALRSDLLVVVSNVSAAILQAIALLLFVAFLVVSGAVRPDRLWILPFALAVQLALQIGIGWFVSIVYVFFRDVGQIVAFALSIVFYLSPVLYPVPTRFESFFAWNPVTPLLGLFRSAVLSAPLPDWRSIVFLLIVASGVFSAGWFFFRRAQGTLADVV